MKSRFAILILLVFVSGKSIADQKSFTVSKIWNDGDSYFVRFDQKPSACIEEAKIHAEIKPDNPSLDNIMVAVAMSRNKRAPVSIKYAERGNCYSRYETLLVESIN